MQTTNLFDFLTDENDILPINNNLVNTTDNNYNKTDIFNKKKNMYQKVLKDKITQNTKFEIIVQKICKLYSIDYPTDDPFIYDEAINFIRDEMCVKNKLIPIFSQINSKHDIIQQYMPCIPEVIISKTPVSKSFTVFKRIQIENRDHIQQVCFISTFEELYYLQDIATRNKTNIFSCPLTTEDLKESSVLYDEIINLSKQKASSRIKNDKIKNLIAIYNSKYPVWCFLFSNKPDNCCNIPFIKNDKDQTINAVTINLADNDYLNKKNDISVFGQQNDNSQTKPGFILQLIDYFAQNKFHCSVDCLVFNNTISISQNKTFKQYLKGCRVRLVTNDINCVQDISNQTELDLQIFDRKYNCSYSKLVINIIPRPTRQSF